MCQEEPVQADEMLSPQPSSGSKQDHQVQEVPEVAPPSSAESSVTPFLSAGENASVMLDSLASGQAREREV